MSNESKWQFSARKKAIQSIIDYLGIGHPQAYIISFPKCGRTWLRVLIGKTLIEQYGYPQSLLMRPYVLMQKAGIKTAWFSHDGTEAGARTSYKALRKSKLRYWNKDIILLVRDPRDVMVSNYFDVTKRIESVKWNKSIADFIRNDYFGIRKYVRFLAYWQAAQHIPKNFLLISYEEMHTELIVVLRKVFHMLGADHISDKALSTAIRFARFDNMQRMEREGGFGSNPRFNPGNVNDIDSYKVRRGRVGAYLDYLSSEDISFISSVVVQSGCSFLLRYYEGLQ